MSIDAPPAQRRRFTLLDVMILVAAIAPGLALTRVVFDELSRFRSFETGWGAISLSIGLGTPVLLTLTPGFLLLRLRGSRRFGKRLWHSQGALNLVTLSITGLLGGLGLLVLHMLRRTRVPDVESVMVTALLLPGLLAAAAGAVGISCRLLGLRGRSLDWVDRLGRIWGWIWLVIAPIDFYTLISG